MIKYMSKRFTNNFHKNRFDMNIVYEKKRAELARQLKIREEELRTEHQRRLEIERNRKGFNL